MIFVGFDTLDLAMALTIPLTPSGSFHWFESLFLSQSKNTLICRCFFLG